VGGALVLLIVLTKLGSSGTSDPKATGGTSLASGGKPTGTKPVKPTQPEMRYVRMSTREETILATLKSAGLPALEGKWYTIGYFDFEKGKGPDTVCPPEQEIDLAKSYPGKQNKMASWTMQSKFGPGQQGNFDNIMPGTFLANLFSITYLYHEVDVPEAVDLTVGFGGEDTLIVFLNREKVYSHVALGRYAPEQNLVPLRFKAGKNQLLLKLCAGGKVTVSAWPQWPAKLEQAFGSSLNRDFPR
jgi:hypothetical protein